MNILDREQYKLVRTSIFGELFLLSILTLLGIFLLVVKDRWVLFYQVLFSSLIIIIAMTVLRFTTKRAYLYFLLLGIAGFLIILSLWEIAFMILGKSFTIMLVFGTATLAFSFLLFYFEQRRSYKQNRTIRIRHGAFNPETGHWDNQIKFESESSRDSRNKILRISKFTLPLGPSIGYFLSRTFAQQGQMEIFSVIFLILASFISIISASYFGLTFEILELERIYNKRIEFVSSNGNK